MARALLYVDDSKVMMPVTSEEDVVRFQDELEIYYDWALQNNRDFNSLKFVVLRYGPNEEIKNETVYFSYQMKAPIDSLEWHKDLGLTMSSIGEFFDHIENLPFHFSISLYPISP